MNTIKIGDVVCIKSIGGPEMTVSDLYIASGGAQMATCRYFTATHELKTERIPVAILRFLR